MTLQPIAVAPVVGLLAAAPLAGVALVNGTPGILSWTAPADGRPHRVMLFGSAHVTSLETGGQVNFSYTLPDGTVNTIAALNSGLAAGPQNPFFYTVIVKPGTTVTLSQGSALTGGAALVWAEIWGS